ncbi:MAG TPA: tetratricopeptide repeat protein, partial [Candidatus Nitrosotenuis sp.]|nr:tetratricopeptide repeat protein [Candidatus Nitrosotenuis sp.]
RASWTEWDHPTHARRIEQLKAYIGQLRQLLTAWEESQRALASGNLEMARICLEMLRADFPNLASVRNNLGWLNLQQHLLALPPDQRPAEQLSYSYVRELGMTVRSGGGRWLAQAAREFEEAIKLDPGMGAAQEGAGVVALMTGDLTRAEELLNRAAQLAPQSASVQNNLGVLRARQGRTAEAARLYGQALALEAGYAPAVYNQALAFSLQGEKARAAQAFQRYLALEPNGWWAQKARQSLQEMGGQAGASAPSPQERVTAAAGLKLGSSDTEVLALLGTPGGTQDLGDGTLVLRYPEKGLLISLLDGEVQMITLTAGSVGEVEVGMEGQRVRQLLGAPPDTNQVEGRTWWTYGSRGLALCLEQDRVQSITVSGP